MDIQTLTTFFMWCTIINGALFVLSAAMCMLVPGFVYRMQSKLFPLPRETYDLAMYSFLGLFKVLFLIFNVTPFVALLIIS